MNVDDLMAEGRRMKEFPAERELKIQVLATDERFPAIISLVLEFEEDLTRSVSAYNRTASEREMDAGGLATMRRFRETIEGILTPAPKEAEVPKGVGLEKG